MAISVRLGRPDGFRLCERRGRSEEQGVSADRGLCVIAMHRTGLLEGLNQVRPPTLWPLFRSSYQSSPKAASWLPPAT